MTLLENHLPTLVIPWPECSHCHQAVQIEDSIAFCRECKVEWHDIQEDAEGRIDRFDADAQVPCEILPDNIDREYDHQGKHVVITYKPCILPSGHETKKHLNPYDYESTELVEASMDVAP